MWLKLTRPFIHTDVFFFDAIFNQIFFLFILKKKNI